MGVAHTAPGVGYACRERLPQHHGSDLIPRYQQGMSLAGGWGLVRNFTRWRVGLQKIGQAGTVFDRPAQLRVSRYTSSKSHSAVRMHAASR